MPKHPQRLYENYKENPNIQFPFSMNAEEENLYQKYMFALEQYFDLTSYLNNTSDNVDEATDEKKGYGRGENGLAKPMDEEMVDLLKDKVTNLISAGQSLYEKMKNIKNPSKEQKAMIFDIQQNMNMAAKENSALESLDTNEPISYMSMHARTTDVIIDVGDDELEKKGAAASTRLAIRYIDESGKFKDGFFTKDVETGVDVEGIYNDVITQIPELKKVCDIMGYGEKKNDPDYSKFMKFMKATDELMFSNNLIDWVKKSFILEDKQKKALDKITISEAESKQFKQICKTVVDEKNFSKFFLEKEAAQEKGYNINNRNTAMSDMATALGMPNIVAKSTPMTIIKDGEAVHGSFMANAKGMDFDAVLPKSEVMQGQKEFKINYDKVVMDAADLMVLDYICLNGDRHQNNMFYIIEKDANGMPVLNGFQGIDNDMSFGNYVPKNDEGLKMLPPLNDIKYISYNTAEMVNKLTDGKVRSILRGKELSEDEINACCERVKLMQEYINSGKPEILYGHASEMHFEELTQQAYGYRQIDDCNTVTPAMNVGILKDNYESEFDQFNKRYRSESSKQKAIDDQVRENTKDRIKNGLKNLKQKVYIDDKMTMKSQQKQVGKLLWKLNSPKKKDSAEYKAMYAKVDDLNKTLKDFQKKDFKINGKSLTNDAKANLLAEKFKDTQNSIRNYVASLPNDLSARDKKNLSTAYALSSVCTDAENSRERQVNELNMAMKKSFAELNRVSQAAKNATTDFDKEICKMELDAKMHLGAFVGNCEKPGKADMKQIHNDLAKILVANKLQQMKIEKPEEYAKRQKEFEESKNNNGISSLDELVENVENNDNFEKIAKNVNPVNALVNNTTSEIQSLANDMKIFREAQVDLAWDKDEIAMGIF